MSIANLLQLRLLLDAAGVNYIFLEPLVFYPSDLTDDEVEDVVEEVKIATRYAGAVLDMWEKLTT
jgi:hypothetical protein